MLFLRILLAATLIASLAACSSDIKPTTSSSASTSSTSTLTSRPTSSPTVATTGPNVRPGEKPPVLSDAARMDSPGGMLAFAEYWINTLDWGYATTNSDLARRSASPACAECNRLESIIDHAAAAGHHFKGGRIVITGASLPRDSESARNHAQAVDVTYDQAAVTEIDGAGNAVGSGHALEKFVRRVWLTRRATTWTVVDTSKVVIK